MLRRLRRRSPRLPAAEAPVWDWEGWTLLPRNHRGLSWQAALTEAFEQISATGAVPTVLSLHVRAERDAVAQVAPAIRPLLPAQSSPFPLLAYTFRVAFPSFGDHGQLARLGERVRETALRVVRETRHADREGEQPRLFASPAGVRVTIEVLDEGCPSPRSVIYPELLPATAGKVSVFLSSHTAAGCWSRRGFCERILPAALELVRAGETHTLVSLRLLDELDPDSDELFSTREANRRAFFSAFPRVFEGAIADVEPKTGLHVIAVIPAPESQAQKRLQALLAKLAQEPIDSEYDRLADRNSWRTLFEPGELTFETAAIPLHADDDPEAVLARLTAPSGPHDLA